MCVWLIAAAGTSALVGLLWRLARRRVAGWNPADRAWALLALASAPGAIPTALSLMLLAPGLAGLAAPGLDHCSSHAGHPHLCLVHPSPALPSFLAAFSLLAVAGLPLAARAAGRRRRQQRRMDALVRLACRVPGAGVDVIESELPFAITTGLAHTSTLVSSGLLDALNANQLEIVLAHEAEHARRRDPLRELVARWLSSPLWPSLRRSLLRELERAAEQTCDEAAARRVGDRLAVADAILAVERIHADLGRSPQLVGASIAGSAVGPRVEALLGEPVRRLRGGWILGSVALALVLALGARPFHHEAEHLIAHILGLQ